MEFNKTDSRGLVNRKLQKVLIVDDENLCLCILSSMLEKMGVSVFCLSNGIDCLRLLEKSKFDLLITDFNMPEIDGIKLSCASLNIAPDMPIIMCTGSPSPEIRSLAENVGIKAVLSKPFTVDELIEVLNGVIHEMSKMQGENAR